MTAWLHWVHESCYAECSSEGLVQVWCLTTEQTRTGQVTLSESLAHGQEEAAWLLALSLAHELGCKLKKKQLKT